MVKVSIVIPVYNVAEYLCKCVDSVLCQSLEDIEIILVDDGSTDDCARICDRYAEQDARVRVIHKENEGLAAARNSGIDVAVGEYIGFVDGDDHIEPEMFEVLYRACVENNIRIAACDYSHREKETRYIPSSARVKCQKLTAEEFFRKVLKPDSPVGMGVWDKLYRRDLFRKARFRSGKLHEDTDILYRLVFQTDFIAYIPEPYYIHLNREGSITKFRYGRRDYDRFEANGRMFRYIAANHLELVPEAADNRLRSMLNIINNMGDAGVYDRSMYRKIRSEVRRLLPVVRVGKVTPVSLQLKLLVLETGYFPYTIMRKIYGSLKRKGLFNGHEPK